MKTYRGKNLKIDWRDDELIASLAQIADEVTSAGADFVLSSAKDLVPEYTGKLETDIGISKSKYKNGGYAVTAQTSGTAKPYAFFVEVGTSDTAAQPYLRPSIRRLNRRLKKMMQDRINSRV